MAGPEHDPGWLWVTTPEPIRRLLDGLLDDLLLEDARFAINNERLVASVDPDDLPEFKVRKMSTFVPMSCCVLTDATGVDHCDHPKPPPPPWWRQLRWLVMSRWWRLRERVGYAIAGHDPRDDDD
jgi:hypothetical protein